MKAYDACLLRARVAAAFFAAALRSCLSVYFDLSPRGMMTSLIARLPRLRTMSGRARSSLRNAQWSVFSHSSTSFFATSRAMP